MSELANPAKPDFQQLSALYGSIMTVVADRLDAIELAIAEIGAKPDDVNNWKNAEFCYLQIRKCVEYVAMAVLAAHQANDYECDKLENAYKADVIFNDLGKLNPHGFPEAVQFQFDQNGTGQHHVIQNPTLSKRRMKRIYDDCAVHLHAGRLSDIINQTVSPYDLPRVVAWREELVSLLTLHKVMLPDVGVAMIIWLRDPETHCAKVIVAQAEGPMQVDGGPSVYNEGGCP